MDVTNLANVCECGFRIQFWNQKSIMFTAGCGCCGGSDWSKIQFHLIFPHSPGSHRKINFDIHTKLNFHCSTRFSITCSHFPPFPAALSNRFNFYLINFPRFTAMSQRMSPSTSASSLIGFCHRQQFIYCMFFLPYHLAHLLHIDTLLTHNLISSHIFCFV